LEGPANYRPIVTFRHGGIILGQRKGVMFNLTLYRISIALCQSH